MDGIRSVLPADATARILEEYLAGVSRSYQSGYESDEAMSTDSDASLTEEGTSSLATSSDVASAFEQMTLFDTLHTADIASDDSAFSSDDEFVEDSIREQQKLRKDLVLGRPPPSMLQWRPKALYDLYEVYIKQLADADVELTELTGVRIDVVVRRAVTVEYTAPINLNGTDMAAIVRDIRTRSLKQIERMEQLELVKALVVLAQALFRREKEIKRILYGNDRMDEDGGTD